VPRHQHSAVDRNRLKRRLRELARVELLPSLRAGTATDIAIRARREAYDAAFDELRRDVVTIRDRAVGARPENAAPSPSTDV
jgi:ribonuclease P protein component